MENSPGQLMSIIPLLMLVFMSIPFAIGNFFLAKRLEKSSVVYAVLSLIPLVNYIFFLYLAYIVLFKILDQLRVINEERS